jgi:predicted nucleic-acid-binding protein
MNMSEQWYVDTNVLLRHLLGDHHQLSPQADAFWEAVRENRTSAVLTEGVLMETVYVLTKFYKVPRVKAVEQLDRLLRYGGLDQEPASVFPSALELFAAESMDFVDCLLVVRERSGKGKVFSFDRKVARG